eukprot:SAG31_NODE_538_length_14312_cov_12.542461_13_plen_72_part_00
MYVLLHFVSNSHGGEKRLHELLAFHGQLSSIHRPSPTEHAMAKQVEGEGARAYLLCVACAVRHQIEGVGKW